MNYLAHALPVLGDPWLVAGTSLPDWLRAVDRRARVRPDTLHAIAVDVGSHAARVKAGALKHHDDDQRFHSDARFEALTEQAVLAIRALSPEPRLRASTLGHIVVEMLLDACIEEAHPGSTARYYAALAELDAVELAAIAQRLSGRPLPSFASLLPRFARARFLFSYATDDGVVGCLEGVCHRTGMPMPPDGTNDVIAQLRPQVRAAATELL